MVLKGHCFLHGFWLKIMRQSSFILTTALRATPIASCPVDLTDHFMKDTSPSCAQDCAPSASFSAGRASHGIAHLLTSLADLRQPQPAAADLKAESQIHLVLRIRNNLIGCKHTPGTKGLTSWWLVTSSYTALQQQQFLSHCVLRLPLIHSTWLRWDGVFMCYLTHGTKTLAFLSNLLALATVVLGQLLMESLSFKTNKQEELNKAICTMY